MLRPSYNPELSAGNHLAQDLIIDIEKDGHDIELITPVSDKFNGLPGGYKDPCKVHRVRSKLRGNNVLIRIFRYIDTSLSMYRLGKKISCDIIVTHSMPPLIGPLSCVLAKRKHVPVIYWEQDVVSNSIISTGIGKPHSLKQRCMFYIALFLEKYTEKHCTHIITISEQFKKFHIDRGIDENKVSVIYNWIDTNQIYPKNRKDNKLFDDLNISREEFVVSYCGNLGVPQNVEIMIDAAEKLKEIPELKFLIIGNGSRENAIKRYISDKNLPNLIYHPLYPLSQACDVYNLGDVGLVIGRKGTSGNGFPSKTWSIMAAGQAMISCFDVDSELSGFVRTGQCGISIQPDSSIDLENAIIKLYDNRDLCKESGKNGRKFAMKHADRKNATRKFLDTIIMVSSL